MNKPLDPLFLRADAQQIPLADGSVHCVVTSPPYLWQRAYSGPRATFGGDVGCVHEWERFVFNPNRRNSDGKPKTTLRSDPSHLHVQHGDITQALCTHCSAFHGYLGLEPDPELYLYHLVDIIFAEVHRILRDDGHLFVNIDDKRTNDRQWMMIPERFALRMQAWGWRLEDKCVWLKSSCMPSSARNRFTHDYEHIFMFNKGKDAYFDIDAVRERTGREHDLDAYKALQSWDSGGLTNNAHGLKPAGAASRVTHPAGRAPRATWQPPLARLAPDLTPDELDMLAAAGYIETTEHADNGGGDGWTLKQESWPGEHYAAFPSSLPERAIKATTSEVGCCVHCGANWERVAERTSSFPSTSGERGYPGRYGDAGQGAKFLGMPSIKTMSITTGWRPTCSCPTAGPVPCTVLDPFGGTGTTPIVASMLGRRGIALDLSGGYIEQAKTRYALALARSQSGRVRGRVSAKVLESAACVQRRLL